ncbi:hypothetical protein TWF730_009523 [Orbilia blumenaviensis]|uniref:RRM domain-containing protein n=1 Tax=Orbilia blumenaviensis TaxID=1796055 RepID=A0AAV9URY6_9PEZI
MPLLEASPGRKKWPPPLATLEQGARGLDNPIPFPQRAYYMTPTIQPAINSAGSIPQPMPASVGSPAPGSGHELRPMASSLSYTSSIALDSSSPAETRQTGPELTNIQQSGILNHSSMAQAPGVRFPTWPIMLHEFPAPSNVNQMAQGSIHPSQLTRGPTSELWGTVHPSNMFPITVPSSEIQQIHNPQSMQLAVNPQYFAAVGTMVPNHTEPAQPNPVSVPIPNIDYSKIFILQPTLQSPPHREPSGFKLGQTVGEPEGEGIRSARNHTSLPVKPILDSGHTQAHIWKGVAEDGLSDLNDMTQMWLRSHITSFDDVLQHIPLEELGKQALIIRGPGLTSPGKGCAWNLVKIENIPYNLDDDMLFEFLGKTPGLVPEEHGGIHIIMDRTTGKTMDCFLEFPTVGAAERFIQRRCNNNRRCILGGRHISLELVRQGELMRWLFPKVRGAAWGDDGELAVGEWTVLSPPVEIVSREELVMILGHARTPHRSPFSRKCLQRPYESLMSVVTKFPWKETNVYTLKQRDLIFQAAFEAGELLKRQILRGKAGPNIDLKLLRRLCRTISFCPGFTYRQKLTFLDAMGITTTECFAILGDLGISHPLATQFQALTVRPGADYVAVEAIAGLVADGVSRGNGIHGEPNLDPDTCPREAEGSHQDGNHELTMRAAATIELQAVIGAIQATFAADGTRSRTRSSPQGKFDDAIGPYAAQEM